MSRTIKNKVVQGEVNVSYDVLGGTVEVLEWEDRYKVLVRHNDKFGYEMYTTTDALEKGMVKNPFYRSVYGIGYFGVGEYSSILGGITTEEYRAWISMFQRCYSTTPNKSHKTYEDCFVCDDWHNFQVFAGWYTKEDQYGLGYHLDKDILFQGNKTYSPKTCTLVPIHINSYFKAHPTRVSELPTGVKKTKSGKYSSSLNIQGEKITLGTFVNVDDAKRAYIRAKSIRGNELALGVLGRVRYKAFIAMINWKF